ncbi:MAG: precorrin-2 C(20)-methyltransferase [Thermodesulfovibrionales bacterium]|nr:precorrin-2 C(20)-methyltransferase [Thermodesulfovibrionales bacterium]
MSVLYVIGVGPGEPELLTLKALRLIREVPVLFVPKGKEEGKSIALSIVEGLVDLNKKEIIELHFPMVKTVDSGLSERWDGIAKKVLSVLEGSDAAFLTLGDPSFYSTFFYLQDRLKGLNPSLRIEIVPGISSINASSARVGIPLGLAGERIAIVPLNYMSQEEGDLLKFFDTVVFMKIDRDFERLKDLLAENGLMENAVYLSRVGMEDEKIIYDLRQVTDKELDYFSIIIVKRKDFRNEK